MEVIFEIMANFEIVTRPNSSLTVTYKIYAVALLSFLSLAIAFFFCWMGAWLVLPFAGMELLAIGYAFYYVHCHSQDYERIVIDDDHISIEKKSYKTYSQTSFNRYWVKVFLRTAPSGDQELFLRSHGREVNFGQCFMTSEERVDLASQLKQRIGLIY